MGAFRRHVKRSRHGGPGALVEARRLRLRLAVGADDNFLDPLLGGFEFGLAMGFEGRAALVKGD